MTPKKLLFPPFLPVALLLLLCAWVFISEATGAVRMIDGRPDNAPARASVILAMLSPLVYIFFAAINLIDATLDRLSVRASWIGTAMLASTIALFLSRGLYSPKVDSTPYFAIVAGFGVSICVLVPMAVIRRCVIRGRPNSKSAEQGVPPNA